MRRGGRVVMRREGRQVMSSGPIDSANVPNLKSEFSALRARGVGPGGRGVLRRDGHEILRREGRVHMRREGLAVMRREDRVVMWRGGR